MSRSAALRYARKGACREHGPKGDEGKKVRREGKGERQHREHDVGPEQWEPPPRRGRFSSSEEDNGGEKQDSEAGCGGGRRPSRPEAYGGPDPSACDPSRFLEHGLGRRQSVAPPVCFLDRVERRSSGLRSPDVQPEQVVGLASDGPRAGRGIEVDPIGGSDGEECSQTAKSEGES